MPRQARSVTSKTSLKQLLRGPIALEGDDAAVGVLDFVTAAFELHHRAANAIEQIERLKAGDHDGDAVLLGQRRILPVAHHAAHVAGQQKGLHLVAGRLHDGLDRRRNQNVRNEQREILQPAALGQVHAHGVGRGGGFKADAEENHLLVGILDGEFNGVQRRIDDAHVAAAALDLEEVALGAGNAQHVAEGAEDDAGLRGDGQRLVDQFERRDADRAAGAVNHLDAGGAASGRCRF